MRRVLQRRTQNTQGPEINGILTEPSVALKLERRARVALRPLRPTDYDALYEVVTLTEGGLFERFQGQTPSPEDFVRGLWAGVLVQFVPEKGSKPIGLLVAHSANLNDGICTVTHVADEKFPDRAHSEALSQFVEYLFANWQIHAKSIWKSPSGSGRVSSRVAATDSAKRDASATMSSTKVDTGRGTSMRLAGKTTIDS